MSNRGQAAFGPAHAVISMAFAVVDEGVGEWCIFKRPCGAVAEAVFKVLEIFGSLKVR